MSAHLVRVCLWSIWYSPGRPTKNKGVFYRKLPILRVSGFWINWLTEEEVCYSTEVQDSQKKTGAQSRLVPCILLVLVGECRAHKYRKYIEKYTAVIMQDVQSRTLVKETVALLE